MEIVTTEMLPPEASMAGTNTVYCHCQALNKRNNYGVCLFTLKAFEEAKLSGDSDCYQTINSGSCEARRLRQQERDAGRALFFKKREIQVTVVTEQREIRVDRDSESYKRGLSRAVATKRSHTPAPTQPIAKTVLPKPKNDDGFSIKGSLSDAVNAAVRMESSVKPSSPKKSLSLLERARIAAASK